jgi:hypothetical protein
LKMAQIERSASFIRGHDTRRRSRDIDSGTGE